MAKITYIDKVSVRSSLEQAQNKVSASDLNEIKESVNALYDAGSAANADVFGWSIYSDSVASNQVISSTPSVLTIDGLGSNTNTTYKPNGYVGEMWASNAIQAESVGDAFDLRIDLTITAKTASPTRIDLILDIGDGAGITIPIVERVIATVKTPPYNIDIGFPIFTLDTFVANGGRIFLSTDTGTVTISNRSIFIKRDFSPSLQPT